MNRFLKLYWKKLLLLLFLFALVIRTGNLFAALDYDEIWTMTYFSTKGIKAIFTELALPNNQPVNSLLVKGAMMLELPLWGIRLHSLLTGVLAVMLMVPIGIKLGGSRGAGFWSALFLLCSAPAVSYSQLARGYGLQLFWLLLYTWGILSVSDTRKHIFALGAMALGGIGAVLTLSTSVIYLGVITLGAFILRPRLPGKDVLVLLGAGVCFCALWYGINFEQFREGQQFGTQIGSHKAFFTFAFTTLDPLIPLSWCPFLVAGAALLPRKKSAVLLGGAALVLLSALVTRGGGPRVYIPLAAAGALLAGLGTDRLCRKLKDKSFLPALAALVCAGAGFYANQAFWTHPDWYALFAKGKAQDQETLVIYSGTNGFPVMWNNQPHSLEDSSARMNAPALRKMLCFTGEARLNGVDDKFNEASLPLKSRGVPLSGGFLYALERISTPNAGDEIILITLNEDKLFDKSLFEKISKTGRFLRLNIFFEENSGRESVSCIRGGIVKDPSLFDWKELPGSVRLYRINTYNKE